MDHNMRVAVSFVTLAAWMSLRTECINTFNIETILASSGYDDTKRESTPRDINFTANQHGLNMTLMVRWFNPSDIFQLYSYIKSSQRRQVNLLLVDEQLTRLSPLPPASSDCPYATLPETFWLYEEPPEPTTDDDCCDGFLSLEEFETEPPEEDVSKCLGWSDPSVGLAAVIRHLMWKDAFVIYDTMNEQQAADIISKIDSCQFVISLIENKPTDSESIASSSNLRHYEHTESKIRLKDDGLEIRRLLKSIHDNTPAGGSIHIVVVCNLINTKRIMSVANIFDAERNRSSALHFRARWLIALPTDRTVGDELTNFLEDMGHLDNVAVVNSRYTQYKQDLTNVSNKLEKLVKEFMTRVADIKSTTSVSELSNVMMQVLQSDNIHCTDTQVNTLYYGGLKGRYLNTVAMVTNTQDVVLRGSSDVFPNTLFALNNRTLKISTVNWHPFVIVSGSGYEGLCMDMLKQMEVVMNFTAEIMEPTDRDWGRPMKNDEKSFTGLVGQLQRQEVDMVVAPLAMDVVRDRVIDFAFPFFTDYTTVVFKRQDPSKSKWRTLIQPFKWQVHLTIWVSLFSVAILITLLERQNPYYQAKSEKSAFYNFIDSIWYMYGSLLTQVKIKDGGTDYEVYHQQLRRIFANKIFRTPWYFPLFMYNEGGEDLPTSTTGLTLVSFWLMFSVVVASTYSGNLIAFLTVNLDPLHFDSMQGMLGQDRYTFGTIGGTTNDMIGISRDPVKQDIWEHIKRFNKSDPSVLSPKIDNHKEKLLRGDYAFIGDRSKIDMWTNTDCELRTIKENFFPVQYAVGLVKNSPYRTLVSRAMLDMSDLGLFQTWSTRRWPSIENCQGKLFTEATAISLSQVQSAFYMMVIGIVMSMLILGAEKLTTYYSNRCGRRRYSFRNSASDNQAQLTLNDSIENTHDSGEMSDRFSNMSVPSAADNGTGTDVVDTLSRDVYTLDKPIAACQPNMSNPLNPIVDLSCADSWDSGFDDLQQRKNPYVYRDKLPFYLSRISLPQFLGRQRSTSL